MTVQILIATMNRDDYSFLDKMNLWGNVIVVNQCDTERTDFYEGKNFQATIYSTKERGLSNSRNMALKYACADIVLTADDDITYKNNAKEMILKEFSEHLNADIISYNIKPQNLKGRTVKAHKKWRKAPNNKYYSSVSLAYRLESLKRQGLAFDTRFGAGAIYESGEESLLLRQARKAHLRIFESPFCLAIVDFKNSTWFKGYDEKFFFDKGAWCAAAYPIAHILLKNYYLKFALCRKTPLSISSVYDFIKAGIKDFRQ